MSLTEYKRKRDFAITAEPSGQRKPRRGWIYVLQKHAASHLHYDFRLQLGDVLKSWAVPKGPSLNPSVKRLAMHVEDHPVAYADFEGIIPQGQYGGGTVMVWDYGDWAPVGDPEEGYRIGRLKFTLNGTKLKGGWMLVRGGGRLHSDEKKWLLIKERDDDAETGKEITEAQPLSVLSGRTLEQITAAQDKVWKSGRAEKTAHSRTHAGPRSRSAKGKQKQSSPAEQTTDTKQSLVGPREIDGAIAARMPKSIGPQLATLVDVAPAGAEWLNEIKFDGYRMICRIEQGKAKFISRNQHDWTAKLHQLAETMNDLPVETAIFDGEVVALDTHGISRFQLLQNAFRDNRNDSLHYFVFDVLYWNGKDLMNVPLEDRKRLLKEILEDPSSSFAKQIHYTDHVIGDGPGFFEAAKKQDLEGIISKLRNRPYQVGRSREWLKTKSHKREEFVIGGYTEPEGQRSSIGALLIGYFDAQQRLHFAGKVGTGFSESTLGSLLKRLRPLIVQKSPFVDSSSHRSTTRNVNWTQPVVVAQIEFSDWTDDGKLRHPAFLGLREDKPAADVVREFPWQQNLETPADKKQNKSDQSRSKKSASEDPRPTTPVKSTIVQKTSARKTNAKKTAAALSTSVADTAEASSDADIPDYARNLTHPDKVLFPDQGVTKRDLADYFHDVADWILPQLKDRLVVLVRCPEGAGETCFYQKHPGPGTPTSIRQIPVMEKKSEAKYLVIENMDSLIWLAQMGVLEIHIWGSRIDDIERPDRLVFDLDPDPEVDWPRVVESARQLREFLRDLGLESFLKTTGGKGLHLVLPLTRKANWDEAKAFCAAVAHAVEKADPERYTSNMSKAARRGRIFIDYLRNQRGATFVAPYSPRARNGAPVSVPIDWKELGPNLHSDHFTIKNLTERLKKKIADPWEAMSQVRQSITRSARNKLGL